MAAPSLRAVLYTFVQYSERGGGRPVPVPVAVLSRVLSLSRAHRRLDDRMTSHRSSPHGSNSPDKLRRRFGRFRCPQSL